MKEAEDKEFQEFIQLLKSAKKAPSHAKPPKSSWLADDKVQDRIGSLEAYAIDAWASTDQQKLAGTVSQPYISSVVISLQFFLCDCEATSLKEYSLRMSCDRFFTVWLLKQTVNCNHVYFCGCFLTDIKIHGVTENVCISTKPSHRYWIFSCTCQS